MGGCRPRRGSVSVLQEREVAVHPPPRPSELSPAVPALLQSSPLGQHSLRCRGAPTELQTGLGGFGSREENKKKL